MSLTVGVASSRADVAGNEAVGAEAGAQTASVPRCGNTPHIKKLKTGTEVSSCATYQVGGYEWVAWLALPQFPKLQNGIQIAVLVTWGGLKVFLGVFQGHVVCNSTLEVARCCALFRGLPETGLVERIGVERTGMVVVEMVGQNDSLWLHAKASQI